MSAGKGVGAARTALYLRLSKDDEGGGESGSITTQRAILLEYAAAHGLAVAGEFIDDGWSGTSFDRPAWRRLCAEIERGAIDCVLTKDLSRLGRNSARVSDLLDEYFPKYRVRYISVIDGYDSSRVTSGTAMAASFLPVVHELYARDISGKIRASLQAKMEKGEYIGSFAPYGYRKDPACRNRLLIDPPAAGVVRRIFRMAAEGRPPSAIAAELNAERIAAPLAYRRSGQLCAGENAPPWTASAVCKLLRREVYLGRTVQGKSEKLSFKSGVVRARARRDWIRVDATHEAIVPAALFRQAARRRSARRCAPTGAFQNLFSGIAFCADCGRGMTTAPSRKKGTHILCCGGYKSGGRAACSNHFTDYELLCRAVLAELREHLRLTECETRVLLTGPDGSRPSAREDAEIEHALGEAERRLTELDALTRALYEDSRLGRIPIELFDTLLPAYGRERETLLQTAAALRRQREEERRAWGPQDALLREILSPEALTAPLLRACVSRIEVGQGERARDADGHETLCQRVTIRFAFREGERP